jgi:hypothetical protein
MASIFYKGNIHARLGYSALGEVGNDSIWTVENHARLARDPGISRF